MSGAETITIPKVDLIQTTETEIELRFIIWGCRSLQMLPDRNSLDVQVRVNIDCSEFKGPQPLVQETDVHYNSTNGNAIFNFRVIYGRIYSTLESCTVCIQAVHFQTLGKAQSLGEVNLHLRQYCRKIAETSTRRDFTVELKLRNG